METDAFPTPIIHEDLLAVEGIDEVNFIRALIDKMGITDVDIRDVGGRTQFKHNLPLLSRVPGFNKIRQLGIIRDAEENFDETFMSIVDVIQKINLIPPNKAGVFTRADPKVGVFIMPDNSSSGMLEDLCLESVAGRPAMECVKRFWDCVKDLKKKPNNAAKSMAMSYLAAMPRMVNSVGLGAKKGYWNFGSKKLESLKAFLENLR